METFELSRVLWSAGKAFLIALVLTPIVRDIFRSYNVVDRPGRRKVHAHPIPRVGGIAIALAYAASLISLTDIGGSLPGYRTRAFTLIAGAAIIFFTGLLDDFFDLKPRYKLLGQLVATVIIFANGLRIESVAGWQVPIWLSFFLTVGWILLSTNALNLIDGLDGLCAGMGLLATLTMFGAAVIYGNAPLAYATLPLAGALLGFLCYNFNPATVFLGDSGALLIGFLLGCYGMIWTQKAATVLSMTVPLLALSVPLIDVSLSVLRRFLRNRPIFGADRGHIHHRLLERGLSPRRAVLILYVASTIPGALALLLSAPALGAYQGVVIVAFCAVAWFGIRQLRYSEFEMVGRLLFGGEFQRTLDARLILKHSASAFQAARDEEDWWRKLVEVAREMNLTRVRWTGERGDRHQTLRVAEGPLWSLRIPLAEDEWLDMEGALGSAETQIDLLPLARIITDAFAASRTPAGKTAVG